MKQIPPCASGGEINFSFHLSWKQSTPHNTYGPDYYFRALNFHIGGYHLHLQLFTDNN